MNQTTISELSSVLRGESMAVESLERVIHYVEDRDLKNELQQLQKNHKEHVMQLAERIQDLGGVPPKGTGPKGKMAEAMSFTRHIGNHNTKDYLKEIYQGEDMGIKKSVEVVKGDLDPQSFDLVNRILEEDRSNMQTLERLITS